MTTPEFEEKMKQGPAGIMSIWPSGGINLATKTTDSNARENRATLWDEVKDSRVAAVIQRRGHEDMALI